MDIFFGFLRRRTDFFTGASEEVIQRTVLNKIALHKKAAESQRSEEEKKKAQAAAETARRRAEEERLRAEAEAKKQLAEEEKAKAQPKPDLSKPDLSKPTTPTADPTSVIPSASPAPQPEATPQSEGDLRAPSSTNGGVGPGYRWSQSLKDVDMEVDLPGPTRGRDVTVHVTKNDIKIALKSGAVLVSGKLCKAADWDDITWTIVDSTTLQLNLPKENKMEWWDCVVQGHPKIDTQKVTPENSKLGDLDGETRATVEKMMYDQQRKAAGLPTSDEQQKQEMLQKFMAAHPEMDFSNAKMM